jgi:hypothetical protein
MPSIRSREPSTGPLELHAVHQFWLVGRPGFAGAWSTRGFAPCGRPRLGAHTPQIVETRPGASSGAGCAVARANENRFQPLVLSWPLG